MPGLGRILGAEAQAMQGHRRASVTREPVKSWHPFGLRPDGRLSAPPVLTVAPLRSTTGGLILNHPAATQPDTTV